MGAHRSHRRAGGGGGPLTQRRALVVPAVPSFSVDGGFRYAIPPEMSDVDVGTVVRVPLGGRRVRGFVVATEAGDHDGLKSIAATSGDLPVFDLELLDALRWAAHHYVSPLSVLLERAAPPNNPRRGSRTTPSAPSAGSHPLSEVVATALARRPQRPVALLAADPPLDQITAAATSLLAAGRSTMVVAATTHEAEAAFEAMSDRLPGATVVAHGDMPDRNLTGAWSRAQKPVILVGTPRVASWQVHELGMAVILEDGRRAMKDRQTPTLHVREILRARSQRQRFALVAAGPTPSTELLATGPQVIRLGPGRLWGNIEVLDRRTEAVGGGVLMEGSRRALAAVTRRGGRCFVFGHRRGYAAAARCGACRTLRICPGCGSRPDPGDTCTRCGTPLGPCVECGGSRFEPLGAGVGRLVAETGRIVGGERVTAAPGVAAVVVGTERDVLELEAMDLVIVPDMDGLLGGTNFRAAEDALRLTARLAGLVMGSGRRMIVQTSDPDHEVVRALVRGDPMPALRAELTERRRFAYPPEGQLLVLEIVGGDAEGLSAVEELCSVMGPAPRGDANRWLLQHPDLGPAKAALRPLVQRWRDSGARVRIDVDPIDL